MPAFFFGERVVDLSALVFDKDGTLFDARSLWKRLGAERLRQLKRAGASAEGLRWSARVMGFSPGDESVDASGPLAVAIAREEAIATAAGLYLAGYGWTEARRMAQTAYQNAESELDLRSVTVLCEGVEAALRAAKTSGVRLAIVTSDSRERSRSMLALAGILDSMDAIVGSEDYARPKPDPEPLLKACAMLGLDPRECAYVGDSPNDMVAAQRAGMGLRVAVLTGVGGRGALSGISDVVLPSAASIRPC